MKFRANSSDLKKPFAKVKPVAKKSTVPLTECVLIQIEDNNVSLQATDTQTSIQCSFTADIEQEGSVLVDALRLNQILSAMSTGVISFTVSKKALVVSGGSASFSLVANPTDNYPLLEDFVKDQAAWTVVDGGKFKSMIQRTLVVNGSNENAKPHINGMFFRTVENGSRQLQLVSTDGQRLNLACCIVENDSVLPVIPDESLIPKSGLSMAEKFIEKGEVKIAFAGSTLFIRNSATEEVMGIRLLTGKFPDFETLLKSDSANKLEIAKTDFESLMRRMAIMATAEYKTVMMEISGEGVVATLDNPELGTAKERTTVSYMGEPITLSLNPTFLLDALSVLGGKVVSLGIQTSMTPVQLFDASDDTVKAMVMPMRA